MKLKKAIAVAMTVILAMSMVACGGAPKGDSSAKSESGNEEKKSDVKTTVLNLDMSVPITSSWGVAAETFASEIANNTEGRYEIKIYTNSELAGGSQSKDLEMLQSGDIDIGIFGTLTMASGDVRIAMSAMPGLLMILMMLMKL